MASDRIPFGMSVRLFWRHLIPILLVPPVGVLIFLYFPRWALLTMIPYFLAANYYAELPHRHYRATIFFWVFAMALWLISTLIAMSVAVLMRLGAESGLRVAAA